MGREKKLRWHSGIQPRSTSYSVSCHFAYKHGNRQLPTATGTPRVVGVSPALLTRASLKDTSAACIFAAEHERNNLTTEPFRPNFAYLILKVCMCSGTLCRALDMNHLSYRVVFFSSPYFFQGRARRRLLPAVKFQQKQNPDDVTYFRTRDRLKSISAKPGKCLVISQRRVAIVKYLSSTSS